MNQLQILLYYFIILLIYYFINIIFLYLISFIFIFFTFMCYFAQFVIKLSKSAC